MKRVSENDMIQAIFETLKKAYCSDNTQSPPYPCLRVKSRLMWYRKTAIVNKWHYHIISMAIMILPLIVSITKLIETHAAPSSAGDWIQIICPAITSILAFSLGQFRFFEKWECYRKAFETSMHVCTRSMVDSENYDYEQAKDTILKLEKFFETESRNWSAGSKHPSTSTTFFCSDQSKKRFIELIWIFSYHCIKKQRNNPLRIFLVSLSADCL